MNRHSAKLAVFCLFCVVASENSRACVPLDIEIYYESLYAPVGTSYLSNGPQVVSGGPVMEVEWGCGYAWTWSCDSGLNWSLDYVDGDVYAVGDIGAANRGVYEEYAVGCNESGSYDTDCAYVVIEPPDVINFHFDRYELRYEEGGTTIMLTDIWRWDSSTGNLADLDGIMVGETLIYPESPFHAPDPPFKDLTYSNRTLMQWEAKKGFLEDLHCVAMGDVRDPPGQACTYTVDQTYVRAGPLVGMGDLAGPITIGRSVWQDESGWHYTCTVSEGGGEATLNLGP